MRVDPDGAKDRPDSRSLEGVELVRLTLSADHRGSLCEIVNGDWPFWREPVVCSYASTVRPGRIKGWSMHREQTDRHFVGAGSLRIVLYDGRTDSPSFRTFQEVPFTPQTPGLLRVPPGIWSACQNWGEEDALIVNFPTLPYDRASPDKYRVSPRSGEIPFDFDLFDY
jgi:dTDP-4-dehydrorhamnose 3,5-epimerase